jgi:hypothetical protein
MRNFNCAVDDQYIFRSYAFFLASTILFYLIIFLLLVLFHGDTFDYCCGKDILKKPSLFVPVKNISRT